MNINRNLLRLLSGAAALAVLVAGVVFGMRPNSNSPATLAFAIEQADPAVVTAFAYPTSDDGLFQLYVTANGEPGAVKLGTPDRFVAVRLSPDGTRAAALVRRAPGEAGDARLYVFELDHKQQEFAVGIRTSASPTFVAWSSDSDRVAVTGSGTLIFDRDGNLIADNGVEAVRREDGRASTTGGGWAWTLDGSHFGSIANGVLSIFASNTGRFSSVSEREISGGQETGRFFFNGWTPDDKVFATYQIDHRVMTVLVDQDGKSTTAAPGTFEFTLVIPVASQASESAAREGSSNGYGVVRSSMASGAGLDVVELRSDTETDLVVVRDGVIVQRVTGLGLMSWGGMLYDASFRQ